MPGQDSTTDFRWDVFVSYSRDDEAIVHSLAAKLRGAGLEVWLDEWEVKHGDSIPAKIEEGLTGSRVLVLCMSGNAFGSDWAKLESYTFRFRDPLNKGRRFLPVRLDDAEIKGSLAQFKYVDWRPDPKPLDALVDACRPPADATPKPAPTQDPEATPKPSTTESSPKTVVELRGHEYGVNAVAMSPDGRRVVSGADDFTVRLWDAETGACTRVLEGHTALVWSVAWAPDGRRVVSGSDDDTIRLWEAETGACTRVLEGHTGLVWSVAWDPDGRRVVSGSDDFTVRLWDAETGECTRVLAGHTGFVWGVAWAPDGRRVVSGSTDKTLRLWDAETGGCTRVLEGHTGLVWGVAWDPDGRRVVSGSFDRTLRVWDAETGACTRVLEGHTGWVFSIAWAPDGRRVVSGSADSTVRLWYIATPDSAPSPDTDADIYTNTKVLLVGDSGVGKSGLANYLAKRIRVEDDKPLPSTDGAWATQWSIASTTEEGVEREIWLWDFAGQDDYRLVHQLFMRDTGAAVLVFNPQHQNPFDGLGRWDADLCKSTDRPFAKHLVAARIDRGGLIVSDESAARFIAEHGFAGALHKTSALTGEGCDELKRAIVDSIDWNSIPKRTSPALYRRLKREIIRLRDEGIVLLRLSELAQRLDVDLKASFDIDQLTTVIDLLDGPGMIRRLDFGGFILLRPEVLSRYAAAAVRRVRKHPKELGCINERDLLAGDLDYQDFERLPEDDEQVILRALREDAVERAWCLRQVDAESDEQVLTFPSYFRRERPDQPDHPNTLVTYRFEGPVDTIYATLVVRLHHTHAFNIDELWRDAADFVTEDQNVNAGLGFTLTRETEGRSHLEVYFEPGVELASKVAFLKYVQTHLEAHAKRFERLRDYSCDNSACTWAGRPFRDRALIDEAINDGARKVYCPMCREPIELMDAIEVKFGTEETRKRVQDMREDADFEIESEGREITARSHARLISAEAGQFFTEANADPSVHAEIEFKNNQGQRSGTRLGLLFHLGAGYSQGRGRKEAEVLEIGAEAPIERWREFDHLMLVVRMPDDATRWVDIAPLLRDPTVTRIEFDGERMDLTSVGEWRTRLLQDA